jgi:hypothetical protein
MFDLGPGVPEWVVTALKRRAAFERARDRRRSPVIHVMERRESSPRPRGHRFRRVRRVSSSSRGDPDDDEPGGAGLPELRVIDPAEFRRAVDRALGEAA